MPPSVLGKGRFLDAPPRVFAARDIIAREPSASLRWLAASHELARLLALILGKYAGAFYTGFMKHLPLSAIGFRERGASTTRYMPT